MEKTPQFNPGAFVSVRVALDPETTYRRGTRNVNEEGKPLSHGLGGAEHLRPPCAMFILRRAGHDAHRAVRGEQVIPEVFDKTQPTGGLELTA